MNNQQRKKLYPGTWGLGKKPGFTAGLIFFFLDMPLSQVQTYNFFAYLGNKNERSKTVFYNIFTPEQE